MNLILECGEEMTVDELEAVIRRPEDNPDSGLFVCCPMENTICNKKSCAFMGKGHCYLTTKQEYAAKKADIKTLSFLAEKHANCFDHIPKILQRN